MTSVQEALGKQLVFAKLLLRGTRDGKSASIFHSLCDNKGPLLVLIKTRKDILCGGFSSIHWKNTNEWAVDKKCFIFSLKLKKIYKRLNDANNLYLGQSNGAWFGNGANLGIYCDNTLYSYCNSNPFLVPKNAKGVHEITEEDGAYEFKDYEVFAISTQ